MRRQRREGRAELFAQMKEAATAEEFHATTLAALARLRAKASQAEEDAGPEPIDEPDKTQPGGPPQV